MSPFQAPDASDLARIRSKSRFVFGPNKLHLNAKSGEFTSLKDLASLGDASVLLYLYPSAMIDSDFIDRLDLVSKVRPALIRADASYVITLSDARRADGREMDFLVSRILGGALENSHRRVHVGLPEIRAADYIPPGRESAGPPRRENRRLSDSRRKPRSPAEILAPAPDPSLRRPSRDLAAFQAIALRKTARLRARQRANERKWRAASGRARREIFDHG